MQEWLTVCGTFVFFLSTEIFMEARIVRFGQKEVVPRENSRLPGNGRQRLLSGGREFLLYLGNFVS